MNNLTKAIVAVVLAAAAGVGNMMWLNMRAKPALFVRLKRPIVAETPLTADMLGAAPIPDDQGKLVKTLVPYKDRAILHGLLAPRNYDEGELFLKQDLDVTRQRWEVLGPFTLVSVGERVRRLGSTQYGEGREGSTITVAVNVIRTADNHERFDARAERLLDILDARGTAGGRDKDPQLRIVAVQLYPRTLAAEEEDDPAEGDGTGAGTGGAEASETMMVGETESSAGLPLKSNQRAIIVPLGGIESMPEILMRGAKIGFVVPARRFARAEQRDEKFGARKVPVAPNGDETDMTGDDGTNDEGSPATAPDGK